MAPKVDRTIENNRLDVKIEVLRVQMVGLEKTVSDSIGETRRWREEVKVDAVAARLDIVARLDKHEVEDQEKHHAIDDAISRLENETLEAGKMVVTRIEALEKSAVAQAAVDAYRRWLIGAILVGGGSLALNIAHALKLIDFTIK
jgi:hypothetical protein